jgi:hypothetical protein
MAYENSIKGTRRYDPAFGLFFRFFLFRFALLLSSLRPSSSLSFRFFGMLVSTSCDPSWLLMKQETKKPLVASWSGEHRTSDEASS